MYIPLSEMVCFHPGIVNTFESTKDPSGSSVCSFFPSFPIIGAKPYYRMSHRGLAFKQNLNNSFLTGIYTHHGNNMTRSQVCFPNVFQEERGR